jgi:prepilin-type processing-associated H-X9-DG protein
LISDYSQAAYTYDYPYDPAADNDADPKRRRAHSDGINVGYLDGHAGWLPDEELGNIGGTDDGSEFYTKGHPFWSM